MAHHNALAMVNKFISQASLRVRYFLATGEQTKMCLIDTTGMVNYFYRFLFPGVSRALLQKMRNRPHM